VGKYICSKGEAKKERRRQWNEKWGRPLHWHLTVPWLNIDRDRSWNPLLSIHMIQSSLSWPRNGLYISLYRKPNRALQPAMPTSPLRFNQTIRHYLAPTSHASHQYHPSFGRSVVVPRHLHPSNSILRPATPSLNSSSLSNKSVALADYRDYHCTNC